MKTLRGIFAGVLGIACVLALPGWAQQASKPTSGQRFEFKYEINRPLAYSMGMKISMDMDMKAGTESMNMKMIIDMHYHVTLTPTADPKERITTMRFEPSNIEGDWDITGPGGHLVMSLRGADMKGTQNGVMVIDTVKDIGVAQAQEFKKEILPLYLSGQMDIDTRGKVKQFRGDIPFVEFWTDAIASQVGFFGVVFPEGAIAVGATWQDGLSLKKMGQIKLEGEGLRCTVIFTRQPDIVVQGRTLAAFTLSAPFSNKDLTGSMEQMGQITRLNISKFDRRATGTFRFDQERGVLTEGTMKADANASMNALFQGQGLTMDLQMDMEMRMNLLSEF
jgi:hypothetical protein